MKLELNKEEALVEKLVEMHIDMLEDERNEAAKNKDLSFFAYSSGCARFSERSARTARTSLQTAQILPFLTRVK